MKELKVFLTLVGIVLWLVWFAFAFIWPLISTPKMPALWFILDVVTACLTFVYLPKILLSDYMNALGSK